MSLAVEEALRRTPVPPWVALVTLRSDPTRPRVLPQGGGGWLGLIRLVNKKGLPVWFPGTARRAKQPFVASFVATEDPVTNLLRVENAAEALRRWAKLRLSLRRRGKLSMKARKASGNAQTAPRPRGILRSMEKTGSNRDRMCVRCDVRHVPKRPCIFL